MRLVVAERGSGRTTELIRWASEGRGPACFMTTSRYIVCATDRECRRVADQAHQMWLKGDIEVPILHPVTWNELVHMRGIFNVEYAIDNLSLILAGLVPGPVGPVVW